MKVYCASGAVGECLEEKAHCILVERQGFLLSGQAIADRLGISRAAVWKRVSALRGGGYAIEGARGVGYPCRKRTSRPGFVRFLPEGKVKCQQEGTTKHFNRAATCTRIYFDGRRIYQQLGEQKR